AADFVVALYNPRSARRPTQLAEAAAILLAHRPPETPTVIARNLGRAGETQRVLHLGDLAEADADMLSLVLIGNSHTRLIPGDPSLYGAIAEQIRRLETLGIPYDVTPGVPAFAAAAAALRRELTLPAVAQSVILTRTATRSSEMPEGESLDRFAATGATLAIHL